MLIDWFTVGAQALNFIILVWLLKRFLYKPMLSAIDAREKRIAQNWLMPIGNRAKRKSRAMNCKPKSKAFDDERGALLAKARNRCKARKASGYWHRPKEAAETLTSKQ